MKIDLNFFFFFFAISTSVSWAKDILKLFFPGVEVSFLFCFNDKQQKLILTNFTKKKKKCIKGERGPHGIGGRLKNWARRGQEAK